MVRCVEKLAVIAALAECVKGRHAVVLVSPLLSEGCSSFPPGAVDGQSEGDASPFSLALAAHSKWLGQAQAETQYREGEGEGWPCGGG